MNAEGSYTIIDPKGVVDDPVMETARFLLNELPCAAEKMQKIVEIISSIVGISQEDILKSMFVDAALSQGWCMEDYYPTQEARKKEKQSALQTRLYF